MFKNMHHGMAGRKGFRAQSGVGGSANFYDLGRRKRLRRPSQAVVFKDSSRSSQDSMLLHTNKK